MERGTGITTRQLQAIPQDGYFVWCNGRLDYPTSLARHLGREDIHIVAPSFLEDLRYVGLQISYIGIDHAATHIRVAAYPATLSESQWEALHYIQITGRFLKEAEQQRRLHMARLSSVVRRKGWRNAATATQAQVDAREQQETKERAIFEQGFDAGVVEGAKLMKEAMIVTVGILANTPAEPILLHTSHGPLDVVV